MRQVFYLFFLDKINAVSEAAVYFVIMQLIMSVRRVFMILFCQSINWCGIFLLHAFLDLFRPFEQMKRSMRRLFLFILGHIYQWGGLFLFFHNYFISEAGFIYLFAFNEMLSAE